MGDSKTCELLIDFKSPRTKCIAFHPTKPIMLTSHHTSEIHAYDLHLLNHIFTFQGHDGPVRSVIFHHSCDIFISGGDDCKIILWSYSKKKILKIFKGHSDYIRSLDFHPINPWFLSTSDDQSIKVWNFQSYKLLSTITGHSHYVMCAKFFSNNIISCSLDQTIRVWDYDGLNKRKENNLIGVPNIIVKQIIDAHDRGINSLYVHPTKQLFLSCADDRQVKVWKMGDCVYEKETYYSHSNNVTGCAFVNDKVVSVGEDGYLIIEGGGKKSNDSRLWCVSTNKDESFYAIGYDSGVMVYKTKGKKELHSFDGEKVYYCKEGKVYVNNMEDESVIMKVRTDCLALRTLQRSIQKESVYSECLLVQYLNRFEVLRGKESIFSGNGKGLLMPENIVSEYRNEISMDGNVLLVSDSVLDLFCNDSHSFFIVKKSCIELFDIHAKRVILSWKIGDIKEIVVGSKNVAFLGTRKVVIIDIKNKSYDTYDELTEVKSGFFENDIFIYSTMRHIKFIYNGNRGILRSMEKQVNLLFMKEKYIFYIHKETIENVKVNTDSIEMIKCVNNGDDNALSGIVNNSKIMSESMINYIIRNKKGDLVSKYVDETKTDLLMEVGRLDEVFRNIESKGDISLFSSLPARCIKSKDIKVAEKCLWNMKDYTKLFYLFICSKQIEKLEMLKEVGSDEFRINLGLFMGDKEYVKKILYKKKIITDITSFDEIKEKYNIKTKLNKHTKKGENVKDNDTREMFETGNDTNKQEENMDTVKTEKEKNDKLTEKVTDNERVENGASSKLESIDAINTSEKNNANYSIEKNDDGNNTMESIAEDDSILEDEQQSIDLSVDDEAISINEESSSVSQDLVDNLDNLNLITVCDKSLVDTENLLENPDYDNQLTLAMDNITSGKFSVAITIFKKMINTIAYNLTTDDDHKDIRKKIGNYLSGILIEKKKKKMDDPKKVLIMSSYFPSLDIEPVHKNLAMSNYMVQCYKNGNFDTAKEIAKNIVIDENTERMVKKVLKSSKKGCAIEFGEGVFCFDSLEYENECVRCKFCFVSSKNGKKCTCCEVGVLE